MCEGEARAVRRPRRSRTRSRLVAGGARSRHPVRRRDDQAGRARMHTDFCSRRRAGARRARSSVSCRRFQTPCSSVAELGPVTCAGCGLLCDDVTVEVRRRPSASVTRVPPGRRLVLGASAFRRRRASHDQRRGGRRRYRAEPRRRASARRPPPARARLRRRHRRGCARRRGVGRPAGRARYHRASSARRWPGAPAVPLRGVSTATLGEIRDRSRVVVIWREDPEISHPRLLDRLGFGGARPEGGDRSLVVVDHLDTYTVGGPTCISAGRANWTWRH